jgi:hypothetical protein
LVHTSVWVQIGIPSSKGFIACIRPWRCRVEVGASRFGSVVVSLLIGHGEIEWSGRSDFWQLISNQIQEDGLIARFDRIIIVIVRDWAGVSNSEPRLVLVTSRHIGNRRHVSHLVYLVLKGRSIGLVLSISQAAAARA